ncbi:MAG: DNA-3-methyladenine glycosylase I, partial [Sphingobacteriales bacterium]
MQDTGIVRNRLKILATIQNAQRFMEIQKEYGSFSDYIWSYVDGKPIVNRPKTLKDIPAKTSLSDSISKDLKKRGFKFLGSTVMYAYMQATGIIDDHIQECWISKKKM